jgi:hypothetical protein
MPRILILLFIGLCFSNILHAQYVQEEANHTHNFTFPKSDVYNSTAWTKTNILTGKPVDLFATLDSGFVIVQEYVMMDCRPCITAGKGLETIITSLQKLYPGRIRLYQTVYEDETNAQTLKKWIRENGFTPEAAFTQGAKEVAFYGGMGMPTILVLGGGMRHKGYYKRLGYSPRENGVIIKAIRRALSLSVSKFETAKQ